MALKSTIFKAALNVADTERHVYGDFSLTIARHPSETDQRMMLRLLAFALHADEALELGRGISTDDEPDLWRKDLTGQIELWIELGTPDPERLRKACNRAESVVLYTYGDRATPVWWKKHKHNLTRHDNLRIYQLSDADLEALESMVEPGMALHLTISGDQVLISSGDSAAEVSVEKLLDRDN